MCDQNARKLKVDERTAEKKMPFPLQVQVEKRKEKMTVGIILPLSTEFSVKRIL